MTTSTFKTETDERYNVTIETETIRDESGKRVKVVKTYTKGARWAKVTNTMKYHWNGRGNAKVLQSDGRTRTFGHVMNAESEALKFANGGTWDFDESYQK